MFVIDLNVADVANILREEYLRCLITPPFKNVWTRTAEGFIKRINNLELPNGDK